MLTKALAWSSLGLALLFVVLAMTGIFAWNSLGETTARQLVVFGAVPALGVSLLLALALLVMSAVQKD